MGLWRSAESQMEQAMKDEDVIGGAYCHDLAGLMAFEGFPIASTFPGEGNPQDHGSWRLTEGSETSAEAAEFINFASVSGTPALTPAYAAYLDEAEIIKEEWEKMLAASQAETVRVRGRT